jgi:heme-degrading monooxygenase HmoA
MLEIIWEYRVHAAKREEFERYYGPDGDWAKFFSRDSDYRGTRLLHSLDDPQLYATVDTWKTREAFAMFKQEYAAEYKQRDQHCNQFTSDERHVGDFETL